MRDERKFRATYTTAIPSFKDYDLSRPAEGAKYVFAENNAANEFFDLPLRRYLIEMIHTSHDSEVVPSDLHYPFENT
jgi:hypothetical protein